MLSASIWGVHPIALTTMQMDDDAHDWVLLRLWRTRPRKGVKAIRFRVWKSLTDVKTGPLMALILARFARRWPVSNSPIEMQQTITKPSQAQATWEERRIMKKSTQRSQRSRVLRPALLIAATLMLFGGAAAPLPMSSPWGPSSLVFPVSNEMSFCLPCE